jgi:hypothetical protein
MTATTTTTGVEDDDDQTDLTHNGLHMNAPTHGDAETGP